MYSSTRGGFRQLLHPYYIVNIFLSLLFIATKKFPFICNLLYEDSAVDFDDYQILIGLGVFIALRSRRQLSITDYVASLCMFAKICNLIMFWHQNLALATIYGVLWLLQACLLFQPIYSGPEAVSYFREATFIDTVEKSDHRVTWVIVFYAIWSPACNALAPIFSELSQYYSGCSGLRFGKIDVSRCPNLARKMGVDATTWSAQLPTIIVFRGGKEIDRRPGLSSKSKKVIKFNFTWENIISAFGLNDIYAQCKRDDAQIKRSQKGLERAKTEPAESKKLK